MTHVTTHRKRPALLAAAAVFGAAALTLGGAAAANAHVTANASSAEAGSYTVVSLSVPHGCEASPTTRVAIKIPEGINAVTPTRNSFYTAQKTMEKLAKPIVDGHGNEVTERVSEVVYTATTPLPADERDVLELSLQLPEDAAGTTLYFPTVQTCEVGEAAWVQIPAAGQDAHELDMPAPEVNVVAAADSGLGAHGHGASADAATATAHTEAAAEASDSGAQLPLIITSLAVGALGLVGAVIALVRGRKTT